MTEPNAVDPWALLNRIANGEVMAGEVKGAEYTHADTVLAYQRLAREAMATRTPGYDLLVRLRFALGDGDNKLTSSQLVRRGYELHQKAAKWDEWHEAQNRVETEMPEGWAFVIQCSPGDWDLYLTNPDGDRVPYDRDCDTLAQQMSSAVDHARATSGENPSPGAAPGDAE